MIVDLARIPNLWFVFYRAGNRRGFLSKEQLDAMQADHIGHLRQNGRAGNFLLAGPVGDDAAYRGIVLAIAESEEHLLSCFSEDPYVQHGTLEVEPYRLTNVVGTVDTSEPLDKIVRHTLAIGRKGPVPSPDGCATPNFDLLPPGTRCELTGDMKGTSDLCSVSIFNTENQEALAAAFENDGSVRSGNLHLDLRPLWLNEGVL